MKPALVVLSCIVALAATVGCDRRSAPADAPEPSPPAAPPSATPSATPPPPASPAPPPTPEPPALPTTPLTPADRAAIRAADTQCVDCHPDEAAAWARSKMGQSFRRLADAPPAPFASPAEIVEPATGHRYRQRDGTFSVEGAAVPGVPEPPRFARAPTHVVGSGTHVHTLLWAEGDAIRQIPLSWYASKSAWDLSPGFDARVTELGFFREVSTGCLTCHTDPVSSAPGADARVLDLPAGPFGCVRCHGDGRAHVAGRLEGRPTPITNPDDLPPARAADICALCHFEGAGRVLRPGHDWGDFLPGQRLADSVAIFARAEARDGFGSADQAGRLALSACAKATPTLTCTTCHAPHPTEAITDRSAPCRACHMPSHAAQGTPTHACADPKGTEPTADCAGCHMDEGPTHNIPHTSGVDHYIRVRPEPRPPANNDSPLSWIAHPDAEPADPDHQLLLGRAYADAWRGNGQPRDAERAVQWLTRGLADRPDRADGWIALAALRRLGGDLAGYRDAAERAFALDPTDRRGAILVGFARFQSGDAAGALAALDRAAAALDSAEIQTLRALALDRLNRPADAEAAARAALALHPTHADARLALAGLARRRGDLDDAAEHYAAAAAWAPLDVRAWLNLGWVHADRRQWAHSRDAYARAEGTAGPDAMARDLALIGQAEAHYRLGDLTAARIIGDTLRTRERPLPRLASLMGRLHLAAGELEMALGALRAAVQIDPNDAEARAALTEAERRAASK